MQITNNSNNNRPVYEDSVDIRKIMLKFRPYWHLFLISLVLGLTGAYMVNSLKEPVYRANSTILIQEDRTIPVFMHQGVMNHAQSNVLNEVAFLESYTLIDSALRNLDVQVTYYETDRFFGLKRRREIYTDSPFRVNFDKDRSQPFNEPISLTIKDDNWYELDGSELDGQYFFGQKVEGIGYSFIINKVPPFHEELHGKSYEFVLIDPAQLPRRYHGSLTIEPLQLNMSVFEISFEGKNRQRSLDFVTALTNTFLRQNLQEKNQIAENTILFIENQIATAAGDLRASEGRLQNFRQREQIVDIGQIASQLVNELQALDRERSVEELKQSYYDFLLEYISDRRDFSEVFGPSALGIEDPMLSNLLVELSKFYTERGRLLLTTTEKSPQVQAIDQNISQVKATMEENIKNIKAASNILMNDINQRINRIEQRISQLPSTERELTGLQRMYNITDATYNFLLEKQAEAGIALASNSSDHKVIDSARYARTIAPVKNLNYALGVLLALGLPAMIIILRDAFNTRIRSKEDVTRVLDFPIVGMVPKCKTIQKNGHVDVVIFDSPFAPETEAFRNIRSNLHFFSRKRKNNLIVVTSARAGEGKTFTSVNLAAALAMSNNKTIYVDADIRKIQPNKFTNHMIDIGLSNYLIGRACLADIISPTIHNENMFVINSGVISPNPAELIESEEMSRLLDEELNEFDYIIVDTAPVGLVADAKPIMAKARLNMFVLRHNYSCQEDMYFIKDYTDQAGLKNAVIVINDIKQTKKGYGYGYGFGYGSGYGYGAIKKKDKEIASGINS